MQLVENDGGLVVCPECLLEDQAASVSPMVLRSIAEARSGKRRAPWSWQENCLAWGIVLIVVCFIWWWTL